jgi:hypothetical protein
MDNFLLDQAHLTDVDANIYMNRFLKHWRRSGCGEAFRARPDGNEKAKSFPCAHVVGSFAETILKPRWSVEVG